MTALTPIRAGLLEALNNPECRGGHDFHISDLLAAPVPSSKFKSWLHKDSFFWPSQKIERSPMPRKRFIDHLYQMHYLKAFLIIRRAISISGINIINGVTRAQSRRPFLSNFFSNDLKAKFSRQHPNITTQRTIGLFVLISVQHPAPVARFNYAAFAQANGCEVKKVCHRVLSKQSAKGSARASLQQVAGLAA